MTFPEEEAILRLQQLNNTQVSVEETSRWFLSKQDAAKDVVKLWFKEFRKAPPKKKIAFLHLANDIVQNGYLSSSQFGKLFEPVLPAAFKETAKVKKHSVRAAVAHLLIVWATRKVYSRNFLRQLRFICQRAVAEADASEASEDVKRNIIATSPFSFSFSTVIPCGTEAGGTPNASFRQPTGTPADSKNGRSRKRHRNDVPISSSLNTPITGGGDGTRSKIPGIDSSLTATPTAAASISAFREELDRELQTESIPPPKIGELIETVEQLQHSAASSDANARRAIAQFPPEVSDPDKAVEIISHATKEERQGLVDRIAECAGELERYNQLLEEEATNRHQFSLKLRAFQSRIRSRLDQEKADLEDMNSKFSHGVTLKQQLINHMTNLPDLSLLPDMTAGLDPLPTVGDLFG